ncbi:MAG: hypothetical protein HWN65_02105 [Candidatus Helarchaeota archaeon]|nr:hypothetical protein [Candidatus Helarchaeota archaeon]
MSSLINRFLKGIKAYFGAEFRYYTITFFFFLVLIAILAPLFILLDIKSLNNIEIVYVIGTSSALFYAIYIFLTLSSRMRDLFFRTKWKYLLGIVIPIGGTLGLSLFVIKLIEVLPPQLSYAIVTITLLVAFLIWLVIQLFAFGLFIKDINIYFLEKIERNSEKEKKRLILFAIIFQVVLVIYLFLVRTGFKDVKKLISDNLFPFPFNLWLIPLIITVFSGILLIISMIRKKYYSAFFSTGYILLYNLYLLYHIGYLMFLIYVPPALFIGTINILSLLFFTISIIYTLQATSGMINTKLERWWQPLSFFLFTIVLLYITWSITFLYDLAAAGVPEIYLEEFFWAINHFISYVFGIILLIVTVFIFMGKLKRKKEVE